MKQFLGTIVFYILAVSNGMSQIDHLVPDKGTLFEYNFFHDELLKVRKTLLPDKESRERTSVVQIVTISGYPFPSVNLVKLIQLGDIYSPEDAKFLLAVRTVLNPEVVVKEGMPSDIKFDEKQIPIDSALAGKITAVWKALIDTTRYITPHDENQSTLDGDDRYIIHSIFTLGVGVRTGVAPAVEAGPIHTLDEAVAALRTWIKSEGHDGASKAKFVKSLEELEKYYLKPQSRDQPRDDNVPATSKK